MSVEFRQRTPGEYAKIAWRRKWLIILPTIAIATAISWVVYKLPSIYESTTLIVVKPPTISNTVVAPITDTDLTLRLNNISQLVTSRSSLEPVIERYNLYKVERQRGAAMEEIVQRMRKDIQVEIARSKDESTTGFQISYRGSDPRATQLVTMELAGKYITENTSATTNMTASTKQFFENEMNQAKAELDEVDRKRLAYMQQNIGHLPSEAPALIGQMTGLREQQKTYITEIGRLRDRRTAVSGLLNDVAGQSDFEKLDAAERLADPKTTPAYGQLAQRKAQLEAELQNMLTTLKPQNPDVRAKQAEVNAVEKEVNALVDDGKNKVAEMRKKLEGRSDPRISGYKTELQLITGEIARQERQLAQTDSQIAQIEQRMNQVPGAEVGLETLNREYLSKKTQYDSLLDKEQRAKLAANVATNQQGEAIEVIDPASLPERPVAPNRPVLMALGLGLGLTIGLLLVALFEVPRLMTIQTTKDAEHYTKLSVLIAVPELRTPREQRRLRMRHALLTGLGVVATVVSIPALAYILKLTRIFELFVA